MSRSSFDFQDPALRTNGVEGERLCLFLEETLDLWGVAGSVEGGEAPVVAVVRAESGAIVWIERPLQTVRPECNDVESKDARPSVRPERSAAESKDERPAFRWGVRWCAAGAAPGGPREVRPRLCGSLVGVLSALREALDVDRGTPLRIAPAPLSTSSTDSAWSRE